MITGGVRRVGCQRVNPEINKKVQRELLITTKQDKLVVPSITVK